MFGDKCYLVNIEGYNGDFELDRTTLISLIRKKLTNGLTMEEEERLKNLNKKIFRYVEKIRKQVTTILKDPLKGKIGFGQDNIVFDYKSNWVVKILTPGKYITEENVLEYYRGKYKILKKFLGNYIPDSYFFEGEIVNLKPLSYSNISDYRVKYPTIYTIQRKIKGFTLSDIPIDIKRNKELISQLNDLHSRYLRLKVYVHWLEYEMFGEIGLVKFKMDLGEISDQLFLDKDIVLRYRTPNIMWDIEKHRLFLVDFDSGSYNDKIAKIFDELLKISEEYLIEQSEKYIKYLKKHRYTEINKKILTRVYRK